MKKTINTVALLLALIFILCSCQKQKKSCEELLRIGLEYGIDGYQDTGYVFLKSASKFTKVFF